jgi:outer membrane protein
MSVGLREGALRLALVAVFCAPWVVQAAPVDSGQSASTSDPSATPAASQSLWGDKTELTVGMSAVFTPSYDGAAQDRWEPLPVFSIQRGILFADTTRGVGLQFQTASGLSMSQSIYYDLGRTDHDSRWRPGGHELAGMGQVPDSYTSKTLVGQQFTPWFMASAEAELTLRSGQRRQRYRAGIELTPWKTAKDEISIDVDGHWGNARFNQAYYGVTALQSSRSGFDAFTPGSGLYAISSGIEWDRTFTPHWGSVVQLTATHYTDIASDSPIVSSHTGFEVTLALTYTF